ncbi:type I restriction enzyme EcoKI subunit R [Salmonella enterica subsp. enterica]|uniref:Type I restriction enzyme EcoKI subunit R n=1 Tax=Salmonella enterica I TaxID=59201 RepID=A0A3S4J6V0_SALET|nr:type I restriction enzyme EcoKI subunit R [Salmonella enterica subsp. enterica]
MSELGLRYYQEDAVRAVEQAIVNGQQHILLAMATGTGKTRTAIALMFRLIQSQRFKRVLFLVDRRSLGEQALGAFEDTRINGDTFNSIFDIKGLTDKFPEDSTKIHVATVQSLVKRTLQSDEPMPVGRYDCIVVDEAHRGYILDKEQTEGELQFRSQLDYVFRLPSHSRSFRRGKNRPDRHASAAHGGYFRRAGFYRYTYRTAVIDGYLIDQDPPIQIVTRNAQDGVYLSEGEQVERLNPQGELINDTLADDQDFEVADFNRGLVIPAFNRAVCGELTKYLDPTGQQKNAGVLRHQRPCRYGG